MIANYTQPRLTIAQLLAATPEAVADRMNPLAVGPQFFLSRYGIEAVNGVPFSSSGVNLPFTGATAAMIPDASFVGVNATELEAEYLNVLVSDGTKRFSVLSLNQPNILAYRTISGEAPRIVSGTGLAAEFYGRPVKVGDVIYITLSGVTLRRVVVGLQGVTAASSYGSDTGASNSTFAGTSTNPAHVATQTFASVSASPGYTITAPSGTWNPLALGPMLGGNYGDQYTLTVVVGGAGGTAQVNIRSASGLTSANNVLTGVVSSSACSVGIGGTLNGLIINLTVSGTLNLLVGQTFVFTIEGAYVPLAMGTNLIASGTFNGAANDTYVIKVTSTNTSPGSFTGATVLVFDTQGFEAPQAITVTDGVAFNVGTHGLQATLEATGSPPTQDGLKVGDTYYINTLGASQSATAFDKIVLNGAAVNLQGLEAAPDVGISARVTFTGAIGLEYPNDDIPAWTVGNISAGVSFRSGFQKILTDRTSNNNINYMTTGDLPGNAGALFLTYRAVVPPAANEPEVEINALSDITTNFGTIDPANYLAYGLLRMFLGNQGQTIFGLRSLNTAAGVAAVLPKIADRDIFYALTPLIDDTVGVIPIMSAHVDSCSTNTAMKFRRCYIGVDDPGSYAIAATLPSGANLVATINATIGGNLLVYSNSIDFTTLNIVPGDMFRTNYAVDSWGNATYTAYPIAQVLSASELLLSSGPGTVVTPAVAFQVWKTETPLATAQYLAALADGVNDRRTSLVWIDQGTAVITGPAPQVVPNRFLAAEIAGIRCSSVPQQGLTRMAVTTVTAGPNMYLLYNDATLNVAAAGGVMIVTQDISGGPVYIRHQLTTGTNDGLLYYEDSLGVIVDTVAFQWKDFLGQYIGQRNVNNQTLVEIRRGLSVILTNDTVTSVPNSAIGPMISGYINLIVAQDPVLLDHINCSATIEVPAPINSIVATLSAEVFQAVIPSTTTATNTANAATPAS